MPPQACSYLPGETASLCYRVRPEMSSDEFEHLLARGWRRHGMAFFRPGCPHCRQCVSLRVDVEHFSPTKSQRRCWQRNAAVKCEVAMPALSHEHLRIFNRYHADMNQRRGWPFRETTLEDYANSFLGGRFRFAREFRYWHDRQLIGVGLVDMPGRSSSSSYFYHDPGWRKQALGVFSMLTELEVARRQGIRYHYLGYWIERCPSMTYKSQYGPHELLSAYVDDDQEPVWEPIA